MERSIIRIMLRFDTKNKEKMYYHKHKYIDIFIL